MEKREKSKARGVISSSRLGAYLGDLSEHKEQPLCSLFSWSELRFLPQPLERHVELIIEEMSNTGFVL